MDISVKSGAIDKYRGACLVVGIHSNKKLSYAAKAVDQLSGGAIEAVLKRGDIDGSHGQLHWLYDVANVDAERILLVGCGDLDKLESSKFVSLNRSVAKTLHDSAATEACSCLTDVEVENRDIKWKIQQIIIACHDALYRFDQFKSKSKKTAKPLKKLSLLLPSTKQLAKYKKAAQQASAIANGITLTKDLGNTPANICNPTYLAKQAQQLAKVHSSLKVKIIDEAQMKKLGMGSLLSVSQGSEQPAKLIIFEHIGGNPKDKPVVLVGKAVTFDTGGISLKPGAAMDEMKYDMCGGASVFGALLACAEINLARNVIGIIPAVENMPSGCATRPGDIYTSMSGQTIEVLNTDAEGRLILCDALTYAERYKPKAVIDIATLTGACIIALGHETAALFSNHQSLADKLLNAGQETGDRCWQLPIWDEYQSQLDSNFADMANIGGRAAGSITSACFLSRFAKSFKWAHLDIAGVAWQSGNSKGATGRPVSLLMQYLSDHA